MKLKLTLVAMLFSILTILTASNAFANTTAVVVQRPGAPAPTTVVITRPNNLHYVCYQRVSRYVKRNIQINRCAPNGVCRQIIIPRNVHVTAYRNCQMRPSSCRGLSEYGRYSNMHQAHMALNRCYHQPIYVQRQ